LTLKRTGDENRKKEKGEETGAFLNMIGVGCLLQNEFLLRKCPSVIGQPYL
jgi:hypothetical protein